MAHKNSHDRMPTRGPRRESAASKENRSGIRVLGFRLNSRNNFEGKLQGKENLTYYETS